ncbi:MAG: DUF1963 domain-containing protein [Pseudomonadota bacterium]
MRLFDRIRNLIWPARQAGSDAQTGRPPTPLRAAADLDALLSATGSAAAAPLVHRVARTCFHILPDGAASDASLGCSRFGGAPDLPIGAAWPRAKDGSRLTFYGQINVDDIATPSGPSLLPAGALLSFFCGELASSYDQPVEVHVVAPPLGTPLHTLSAEKSLKCLNAIRMRFEAGLSFPTESLSFVRELEAAAPECDIDALLAALGAAPEGAIGQTLGYAQFPFYDVHASAYFAQIGRAGQDRLAIWESWDAWSAAKDIQHRMQNGQIYRPWSAADDDNVRWILAHKAAIAAGIEQWHCALWIASNRLMNLWINDADPIYFLAKRDDAGLLDLSNVHASATQS